MKLGYRYRARVESVTRELESDPSAYIGLFLERGSPASCPWHSALSSFVGFTGSIKSFYASLKDRYFRGEISGDELNRNLGPVRATARSCPAINHVLSNSYIVKCPVETHISISPDGRYVWNSPSTKLMNVSSHPTDQYTSEGSTLFNNRINLKFELPVILNSHKQPYMFLQPSFHLDAEWETVNGAVTNRETLCQQLNVNTFFRIDPTRQRDIVIPVGTPLAYLWFAEMPVLEYDSSIQDGDFLVRYSGAKKFFFKE